jgi:hypothetical protein
MKKNNRNGEKEKRVEEAIGKVPELKPANRWCRECGEKMEGKFIDAEFDGYNTRWGGAPVYFMTVDYVCPNGHNVKDRQGVNNLY